MPERNHDGRNQDDWMQALALRVEELVRRPAVRERFRAMIDAWRTERDRQLRAVEQWERRRAEHFKNEITTNPQLQDRACGPPAERWNFQPYFCSVGDSRNVQTGGWFPPDLCLEAKPKVDAVLSFTEASRNYDLESDPKRPLTLPEKYALCAALHDAYGYGLEPIVPDGPYEDAPAYLRTFDYFSLCSDLNQLQPGDRALMETFLKHVVEDLTEMGMPLGEGAAEPREEGKADRRDSRLKWLADAMLLVKEYPDYSDAEIARQVGRDPSRLSRSKEYKAAAALAREGRPPRRGYIKNVPDGGREVEAIDETADFDDLDARLDAEMEAKRNASRNANTRKRP